MEDAIKILSTKFTLSSDVLSSIGTESEDISKWLVVLGAYVLDSDKKHEEQKEKETTMRKERLNAEHQLNQLEKQLISCNAKLSKFERNLLDTRAKLEQTEQSYATQEKKFTETLNQTKVLSAENDRFRQKYNHLEQEKGDFAEIVEKKNAEIERLNQEWTEMSNKLSETNKSRYEFQYKLDEIKNSDIRKEFKEKRLEQEKTMLLQQMEQMTEELKQKSVLALEAQKDKTSKLLDLESKYEISSQENVQLKSTLDTHKKLVGEQKTKIQNLMRKIERNTEEHAEATYNMQLELTAQTKLVNLYKEDRDHAKSKLGELTSAVTELQTIASSTKEEKLVIEEKMKRLEKEKDTQLEDMRKKIKDQSTELEGANDLLQVTKKKDRQALQSEDISSLSPMAAASSAILKKGMTLTQIYSEYVKVCDQLTAEKDENARLKMYMEQILAEVEEKAPMLIQQKEDHDHLNKTVEKLSTKLEDNIKECNRLKCQHNDYERKIEFHKREEKRLHVLSIDLSQQVRLLLKEVEEARGGVVSSTTLPNLVEATNENNVSSSGQVISEHLVTFKSIEELQSQNQRLLLTVRELSEEQEKLEQEGGSEIIHELKKKIKNAKEDLEALKENEKTQQEMMHQIIRQRDMYKVLCQSGHTMVGDVSSTTMVGEAEIELSKVKAELENSLCESKKFKEQVASKEGELQETISKQEDELQTLRLKKERLKNKLEFADEKHSILNTTAEGFKKEIKALEAKSQSITTALNKTRVEAEKAKQEHAEMREKLIASEVSVKSLSTEKHLIQQAEKRLMQENQSLLDQQRSQNVLLTNLQTIQNNLEKQEFTTRTILGKQVESLQREVKAMRRNYGTEGQQLKSTVAQLEKEVKELRVKLGVEMETKKQVVKDLELSKQDLDQATTRCKELESLSKASDERLKAVLDSDGDGAKEKEDYLHEVERHKVKIRQLEVTLSTEENEKKSLEDQLAIVKKHLEQYKEIGDSNEQAITTLNQSKDAVEAELQKKLKGALDSIASYKKQVSNAVLEKMQIKKSIEKSEKNYQSQIAEIRTQVAPLERRFQEVTRALVQAKELEQNAVKEAHNQVNIANQAQEKYERELVLHAKDVEQLTLLKDEFSMNKDRLSYLEGQLSSAEKTVQNNNKLMGDMKHSHTMELRKGETSRKDLIDQNAILHSQVEKLSAQLAEAKSQNREHTEPQSSSDKTLDEVYELLRFVRREKEIAETSAEASKTESMRFRQRAEHLQRDVDETKAALEIEMKRTQGRMLTEEEHNEMTEKVKKASEYEVLNQNLEKKKLELLAKNKELTDFNKKIDLESKQLRENKKSLESEKSSWIAEKTALKSEIERWTARTNQLMAQSTKSDNEEVKKLTTLKTQNEKSIQTLRDEAKRNKLQLDMLKREKMKMRSEKTETQNKITALESQLTAARGKASNESESNLSKQLEQMKTKNSQIAEKSNMVRKLARKYRTQSDQLQKLLKDNNIDYSAVISGTTADQPPPLDSEEKKKLETQLNGKTKEVEELQKQLSELSAQENTEQEKKLEETQQSYIEAEKTLLLKNKEIETLKNEATASQKKLEEVQDKNKKLLKTCKDKITSLTKLKDSSNREIEALKTQLHKVHSEQEDTSSEQKNAFASVRGALEEKLAKSNELVEELKQENQALQNQLNDLNKQLEKAQEDKIKAESFIKAPSQKKARIHAAVTAKQIIAEQQAQETPLTATVRPTATPPVQKFHPSNTPTASIRPLVSAHPTAMVSPTPAVVQTPVASVSALPATATHVTQVAEVHPSNRQVVAPVARVAAQEEQPEPPHTSLMEVLPSTSSDAPPTASSTSMKRPHHTQQTEDSLELLEDDADEEPGSKRQRVEPSTVDEIQQDAEEDLLSEEADDVIEDNSVPQLPQETNLQEERLDQPSPQNVPLRPRQNLRGRTQLPSFSLHSGQGSSSGFYEETDDSMVPSTPTLYMPKRTDGFAEAVSSPVVRFPGFSFTNNEQSTQAASIHQQEEQASEAREDTASVPLTPLSIVPTSVASQPNNQQEAVGEQQFFSDDLQHVPQQQSDMQTQEIEEQPDDDEVLQEEEEEEEEEEEDLSQQMQEPVEGGDEEGLELFAPNDTDLAEEKDESDDDSTSDDSDDSDQQKIDGEEAEEEEKEVEDEEIAMIEEDEHVQESKEEDEAVITIESDEDAVEVKPVEEVEKEEKTEESTKPVRLKRGVRLRRELPSRAAKSAESSEKPS